MEAEEDERLNSLAPMTVSNTGFVLGVSGRKRVVDGTAG